MFSHCYPIIWMMKSKQQKSLNFPSFLFNTEVKPQSVTHQQLLKKKKKILHTLHAQRTCQVKL